MTRPGCAPAIFSLLGLLQAAAQAQEVRDFNADTPGKSNTPYTVSQGYFQLESDSFHIVEMGMRRPSRRWTLYSNMA